MRHLILAFLFRLPLFLAPLVVLAADPKPKTAGTDQPQGGAVSRQSAFAGQAGADAADSENADASRAKSRARPTSIDIIPEPGGRKTLTIHFRWSLFPNASVEVRLAPGEVKKDVDVVPIYFADHLKGELRQALYTCLDHPGGLTHSVTEDKTTYKMIGGRNSLGKQGVHVQVNLENLTTRAKEPAAAYLQLDTWAVDQDTLALDLARDEFAKPGTLFVWFFRGNENVWEEQIPWPGYK